MARNSLVDSGHRSLLRFVDLCNFVVSVVIGISTIYIIGGNYTIYKNASIH